MQSFLCHSAEIAKIGQSRTIARLTNVGSWHPGVQYATAQYECHIEIPDFWGKVGVNPLYIVDPPRSDILPIVCIILMVSTVFHFWRWCQSSFSEVGLLWYHLYIFYTFYTRNKTIFKMTNKDTRKIRFMPSKKD